MPQNSITNEILQILENGEFERLIGKIESESFDCKSSPYQLDNNNQKFEMAKDACAFANANGGIILIGARTRRSDVHSEDEIEALSPFPGDLINFERCLSIVDTQTFPRIEHIEAKWFPSSSNDGRGVAAFIIPKQPEELKPFLLTKPMEGDIQTSGFTFGYAERRRAGTSHMNIQQFHSQLKMGGHSNLITQATQEVQETLARVLERLNFSGSTQSPGESVETELNGRIEDAIGAAELNDQPLVVIAASPYRRFEVTDLFEGRDNAMVRLLERPPELRPHGFDVTVGTESRIIRAQLRRSVMPGVRLLELWRDGTLIFVGTAESLCWGLSNRPGQPLRINPLALVEMNYLFAELYHQIVTSANPEPTNFLFSFRIQNFTVSDQPSLLAPGPLNSNQRFGFPNTRLAPDSCFQSRHQCDFRTLNPGMVAFCLVREIYNWFGHDNDAIPYIEEQNGFGVVSTDMIRNAGR
ncbi:MAG: ATP-binding protein [Candidatus Tectomicrobia bacterium]|nr:ATP-binding protein [Candidatus Tectomicrobia bacterium]